VPVGSIPTAGFLSSARYPPRYRENAVPDQYKQFFHPVSPGATRRAFRHPHHHHAKTLVPPCMTARAPFPGRLLNTRPDASVSRRARLP